MINNFAYVSLMDFVLHFFVVVAAPVAIFTNSFCFCRNIKHVWLEQCLGVVGKYKRKL